MPFRDDLVERIKAARANRRRVPFRAWGLDLVAVELGGGEYTDAIGLAVEGGEAPPKRIIAAQIVLCTRDTEGARVWCDDDLDLVLDSDRADWEAAANAVQEANGSGAKRQEELEGNSAAAPT